jgi:hypothetical protein
MSQGVTSETQPSPYSVMSLLEIRFADMSQALVLVSPPDSTPAIQNHLHPQFSGT